MHVIVPKPSLSRSTRAAQMLAAIILLRRYGWQCDEARRRYPALHFFTENKAVIRAIFKHQCVVRRHSPRRWQICASKRTCSAILHFQAASHRYFPASQKPGHTQLCFGFDGGGKEFDIIFNGASAESVMRHASTGRTSLARSSRDRQKAREAA